MFIPVRSYAEYLLLWEARLLWWRLPSGELLPPTGQMKDCVPEEPEMFEWDRDNGYAYGIVTEE